MTPTEQPLFDAGPPTLNLTQRQRRLYDAILETGGLEADEAGALLHEHAGKHGRDVRCRWCSIDGRGALKALRRKNLVVRRRSGVWTPIGLSSVESAQTEDIPF